VWWKLDNLAIQSHGQGATERWSRAIRHGRCDRVDRRWGYGIRHFDRLVMLILYGNRYLGLNLLLCFSEALG